MSIELAERALSLHDSIFRRIMPYRNAMIWDCKQKQFHLLKSTKKLIVYYIVVFGFQFGLGAGLSALTLLHKLFSPLETAHTISFIKLAASVGLIIAASIQVALATILYFYGDDLIFGFNEIVQFQIVLSGKIRRSSARSSNSKSIEKLLVCLPSILVFFLLSLTPFIVYEKLDPFAYPIELLFPIQKKQYSNFGLLSYITRLVLSFICMMEAARMWAPTLVISSSMVTSWKRSCELLATYYEQSSGQSISYIHMYNQLTTSFKILETMQGFAIFLGMGVSLVAGVVANFSSIRMYHVIPMPIYLLCPAVSFSIIIANYIALPMGISVHELSSKLLHTWKSGYLHKGSNLNRKYVHRKLIALQVICFSARVSQFKLFSIVSSIKTSYYDLMLSYTIDALLSIPN